MCSVRVCIEDDSFYNANLMNTVMALEAAIEATCCLQMESQGANAPLHTKCYRFAHATPIPTVTVPGPGVVHTAGVKGLIFVLVTSEEAE